MDENEKLPCGHTVAEHRKMFGQAGDLLDIQGPTKAMAASLVAQALEHSAGNNFTAGIRALFWLVNSFDSEPEALPPGCKDITEGRQQAAAFALAAFTATDLQIQSGNSFPQQWMQAPAAGETYH